MNRIAPTGVFHRLGRPLVRSLFLAASLAPAARAELRPPTPMDGAFFGTSVAHSGELLVVGEPSYSSFDPGKAYVYRTARTENWPMISTLAGSDTVVDDHFGTAVAIQSGSDSQWTVAVGAPGHQQRRGAVYLFRGDSSGFTQIAKLQKPDGAAGDSFGYSLAFSSDRRFLAVGAPVDHGEGCPSCPPGSGAGSVSIFQSDSSQAWTFLAEVTTGLQALGATGIGSSITFWTGIPGLANPELIVGAPGTFVNGVPSGALFVIRQSSPGVWEQTATIVPSAPGVVPDRFGASVSVSPDGSQLVAGDIAATVSGVPVVGTVFRFQRTTSITAPWSSLGALAAPPASFPTVGFGEYVTFIANDLLAARTNPDEVTVYRGSTPFQRLGLPTYLGGPPLPFLGQMATFNGSLAIGAPSRPFGKLNSAGSVLLFDAGLGKFGSIDPAPGAGYGTAVALLGNLGLVGQPEPNESTLPGAASGRVEVVLRNPTAGTWSTIATIPSPLPVLDPDDPFHRFGSAISLPVATRAVVGAPTWNRTVGGKTLSKCGTVSLMLGNTSGTAWTNGGELPFTSAIAPTADEQVGTSVVAFKSGTQLFIAAGGPGFSGSGDASGRVHLWRGPLTGNASQFVYSQVLQASTPQTGARFGFALAMEAYSDGTIDLWVGAPDEDTPGTLPGTVVTDAGSIYLFRKAPSSNTFVAQNPGVRHPGTPAGARYGSALALRSGMLAVGAPNADNSGVIDGGRVYGWKRNTGTWTTLANAFLGTLVADAQLGASLANSGKEILAGEPGANSAVLTSAGRVRRLKFTSTGFSAVSIREYGASRANDRFGASVAMGPGLGDITVLIGSPGNGHGDIDGAGTAIGFVTPQDPCVADIDVDYQVGPADLAILIAEWGPQELGRSSADLNDDGQVDGVDLSTVLSNWQACTEG